jgi:hypothetical protein
MYTRFAELSFELEHRHNDGSWSRLERATHDPAQNDPEREWNNTELYACSRCDEQVRVRHTEALEGGSLGGR